MKYWKKLDGTNERQTIIFFMECTLKKDPVFENYTYAQQANSLKMVINWVLPAVRAHMRKGLQLRKAHVPEYAGKVARHLRLIAARLDDIR